MRAHAIQDHFNDFKIESTMLQELAPLEQERSNYQCLRALATNYLTIAVAIYLSIGISYWFYPLSVLMIGATQRALTNLLHEATHTTLAAHPWLNYLGGTLLSGHLVFHMFVPYKHSHIGYHHPRLADPELDPDYKFHIQCGLYNDNESMRTFFIKNVLLTLVGFRSISYAKYILHDRILFTPNNKLISTPLAIHTERIMLSGLWCIILAVFSCAGWLGLLIAFWFVPLFTAAIAIGWIIELSEHYPLPQAERSRLFQTRNRHGGLIERFIFGRHNDNYHLVHHLRPGIPYFNLDKAHCILLQDPRYRAWDAVWGGIFTTSRPGEETVFSYIAKYRLWRLSDCKNLSKSFAMQIMTSRAIPAKNHKESHNLLNRPLPETKTQL